MLRKVAGSTFDLTVKKPVRRPAYVIRGLALSPGSVPKPCSLLECTVGGSCEGSNIRVSVTHMGDVDWVLDFWACGEWTKRWGVCPASRNSCRTQPVSCWRRGCKYTHMLVHQTLNVELLKSFTALPAVIVWVNGWSCFLQEAGRKKM